MEYNALRQAFMAPADEFSPMPFWFWNDELTEAELTRQIDDFQAHGVMGFVIHPRKGLPASIGYLSDRYMHFVRHAVVEAARRGMRVVLYDEGMYPSGAAHGMVAAENPAWASRCLWMEETTECAAAADVVAVCAVRVEEGRLTASRCLQPVEGVYRCPEEGWRMLVFRQGFSGGTIRGVHEQEDDGEPNAPRSADLMNPEAVQAFIRLTHERYYAALPEHFGSTVIAMFTDEPDIVGRNARRGALAWTEGFLAEFGAAEDLPCLFLDAGERSAQVRRRYRQAVNERLIRTYYQPLADWCAAHGIALTGHPAKGWDIGLLTPFQIPGQDVVWRYVEPGRGVTGDESVLGKCGADAARHLGRRRNANECFGCCGPAASQWGMTPGDMKWYMDYLFVRGVNLLYPHAFYYSVRDGRGDERPPDVGPNNLWWTEYRRFADYMRRLSWLMTDSVNQARVAVLCEKDRMPWECCIPLYENQIEFNYLEASLLADCRVEAGALLIREQRYTHVIYDGFPLEEAQQAVLAAFRAAGGVVLDGSEDMRSVCPRDVSVGPRAPGLRVSHVVKAGKHFFLFTNEGDKVVYSQLNLSVRGYSEWWDPWRGTMKKVRPNRWEDYQIILEPRESIILFMDEGREHAEIEGSPMDPLCLPLRPERFTLTRADGATAVLLPNEDGTFPGWETIPGWETYSGWVTYETDVELFPLWLDVYLGEIHEIARVYANGELLGTSMWGLHRYTLPEGPVHLRIEVCNTPAGKMDGVALPSGYIGVAEKTNPEETEKQ